MPSLPSRSRLLGRVLKRGYAASAAAAELTVSPSVSLADEPVSIAASGLSPSSAVSLELRLECASEKLNFKSWNRYRTCDDGRLDVGQAEALDGGDYCGVDGMGPVWSMKHVDR